MAACAPLHDVAVLVGPPRGRELLGVEPRTGPGLELGVDQSDLDRRWLRPRAPRPLPALAQQRHDRRRRLTRKEATVEAGLGAAGNRRHRRVRPRRDVDAREVADAELRVNRVLARSVLPRSTRPTPRPRSVLRRACPAWQARPTTRTHALARPRWPMHRPGVVRLARDHDVGRELVDHARQCLAFHLLLAHARDHRDPARRSPCCGRGRPRRAPPPRSTPSDRRSRGRRAVLRGSPRRTGRPTNVRAECNGMESICPSMRSRGPLPSPISPIALPAASTRTESKPIAFIASITSSTAFPSFPDTLGVVASERASSTNSVSSTAAMLTQDTSASVCQCHPSVSAAPGSSGGGSAAMSPSTASSRRHSESCRRQYAATNAPPTARAVDDRRRVVADAHAQAVRAMPPRAPA